MSTSTLKLRPFAGPFDADLESWRPNWNTNPNFDPSLWSLAVAGDEIIGLSLLIGH